MLVPQTSKFFTHFLRFSVDLVGRCDEDISLEFLC